MWTLPKDMFELLGGSMTGSVAVSFIPSRTQSSDPAASWTPQPAPMLRCDPVDVRLGIGMDFGTSGSGHGLHQTHHKSRRRESSFT